MDFASVFDSSVNDQVQQAILRLVLNAYRQTSEDVEQQFAPHERTDAEPVIRRANIESGFSKLGQQFPAQVRVMDGTTTKGCHFRYLVCGDVVLTQSYVEDGRRVPRKAEFRNAFAGDPNQGMLFPEAEAERIQRLDDNQRLYAILTHTPVSRWNSSMPSHISVVFVDDSCRWVAEIDLLNRLRRNEAEIAAVEEIEDKSVVKLRPDVAAKRDVGA